MSAWTIAGGSDFTWTLLGRLPVVLVLAALTQHARKAMGTTCALLGLSAFSCGAMVGTALAPSIVGAVVGGVVAVVVTWWLLDVPRPEPAPFALGWLALLVVGRFGCLLAGCCFGRPTEVGWAVHYGAGTFAQHLHHELGLVAEGERSLGVHPVQVYEALAVVAWIAVSPWLRKRLRSDGAWALLSGSAYLLIRAALDPLRAMLNTRTSLTMLGPASLFQVACLGGALALAAAAWWWRRHDPAFSGARTAFRPLPGGIRLAHQGALGIALQASLAVAALPESTRLLRALTLLSLAFAAMAVVHERLKAGFVASGWALACASLLLLLPLGLRADDGVAADSTPHWLYTAIPRTGQLVRVGTTLTSAADLVGHYAALLSPASNAQSRATGEAASSFALGTRQGFPGPGCPGEIKYQSFIRAEPTSDQSASDGVE